MVNPPAFVKSEADETRNRLLTLLHDAARFGELAPGGFSATALARKEGSVQILASAFVTCFQILAQLCAELAVLGVGAAGHLLEGPPEWRGVAPVIRR
jgi:hypothetical protein